MPHDGMSHSHRSRKTLGEVSTECNRDNLGTSHLQQAGLSESTSFGAAQARHCLAQQKPTGVHNPDWLRMHWCELTHKAVGLAKRMGLDSGDGEDALTDACMVVWLSQTTPESPLPYILGVTKGLLRNHKRVQGSREKLLSAWGPVLPEVDAGPERMVATSQLLGLARKRIESLAPEQAQIFSVVVLAEQSASSTSWNHLGGSARVRQVVCRIRKTLNDELTR